MSRSIARLPSQEKSARQLEERHAFVGKILDRDSADRTHDAVSASAKSAGAGKLDQGRRRKVMSFGQGFAEAESCRDNCFAFERAARLEVGPSGSAAPSSPGRKKCPPRQSIRSCVS